MGPLQVESSYDEGKLCEVSPKPNVPGVLIKKEKLGHRDAQGHCHLQMGQRLE